MAQLKDLIVTGASRFIGDVIANQIQITALNAPTSAGGTTYGAGTSGQALFTNGTSAYWGNVSTADEKVKQTAKTDNVNYKILFTASASPTSAAAAEAAYDTDITINPSTNTITATTFSGNATSATKVGHKLKIGTYEFDGSANIAIPIYNGSIS